MYQKIFKSINIECDYNAFGLILFSIIREYVCETWAHQRNEMDSIIIVMSNKNLNHTQTLKYLS